MAKFTFSLEAVLRIKMQKEESVKNELGKATQKLEAERQKLAKLYDTVEEIIAEFNKKAKKTTVRKLIEFNEYLSLLDSKIKEQKERVNCAASYVDKVREELLQAVKERKILEKLKEKKYDEYLLEQKKLEQKANDELVSFKHKVGSVGD
ncbi:MAG: flagellar export protein FliJ [Clostridiaceae bacterium]|jgi:flagellar FliJ protein|nr:flagellar export protein FliJ [Clostridiaceae bacterium]